VIVQLVASGVDALAERYGDRAPARALDATQRLAPHWGAVLKACAEGPRTVIHNDCRLDNVFFERDGSPVFVDWQTVGCGRGTQDVGNLLAGSMNIPELRVLPASVSAPA
jgi:Ser/Thr protein kinase RdoA (MazF antagonist)